MSATEQSLQGRTLGDFVVRDAIGKGGFGVVYRAEQPLLGREAAIKVLHTKDQSNAVTIQRFLLEARLASQLDHPFAAHIYAFGVEPDGLLWIAMEMVTGTPLEKLLLQKGSLPLSQLVPLVERISEVVQAAHERGIVHRDIKPANVMILSRAGRLLPKLLDFGIARALGGAPPPPTTAGGTPPPEDVAVDEDTLAAGAVPAGPQMVDAEAARVRLTLAGQLIGSPFYMAPEQWVDASASDTRADLYALGVMTYEALTGRRPIEGPTLYALADAHAHAPVPPLGNGLPDALHDVFRKAMAKDPADRYTDAISFSAALRSAAGLEVGAEQLPTLDENLRVRFLAHAPHPIAEAVAELDAAHHPNQACDALETLVATVVRYVGVIALACRARVGPGGAHDVEPVLRLLRELRSRPLADEEWVALARGLVQPFAGRRDLHPIPELVDLFARPEGDPFAQLWGSRSSGELAVRGAEQRALETLRRRVPELARLLGEVSFLLEYPLVAGRAGGAESWMGTRRQRRPMASVHGDGPAPGRAVLLDAEGRPQVPLWPLLQMLSPAPGAAEEVFLVDGGGRGGARLVALPAGFEHHDPDVWPWMRERLLITAEDGTTTIDDRPPYRGLVAFSMGDADLYVGREREIEAAVNRLRTRPLLAVVGPSGAGKSSFVQAGVVPALPTGWRAMIVRPGPAPVATLEAALRHDPVEARDGTLVLVIDQLEELFTLCPDPEERERFAERIALAARTTDDPTRVVLTLRDDFLMRASELPALGERIAHDLQLLGTPAPDELLRILVEPARRAGYRFEDADLPRRMVAEVAGRPGALALLSFAASRMWELRDRHFQHLPTRAYDSMGGVGGALALHAEQTLAAMGAEEQRLVRETFRNLVTAEGTRAVLRGTDLTQLLGPAAPGVIEKLVAARLITAFEGERGEEHIEVAHEALFDAWPRLVTWRREDAEGVRLRDQLRVAVRAWSERGRPRGLLWRDEALAEYRAWRARWPGTLTDDEDAFARASLSEAVRGRRLRRAVLAMVVAILGVAVAALAWSNRRTERERGRAEALAHEERGRVVGQFVEAGRQLLLRGDAARALVYLVEAGRQGSQDPMLPYLLADAARPVAAQIQSLEGHRDQVRWLELSPDGRLVLTASKDGTARLWDAATGAPLAVLEGARSEIQVARFDPAGRRILTVSFDGAARIYDTSGTLLAVLPGPGGPLLKGAWTPDGTRVVFGGSNNAVLVADAASGRVIHRLDQGSWLQTLAVSPDGALLVTTPLPGTSVHLWDLATGKLQRSLDGHHDLVVYAGFNTDGSSLVTTSFDGTALLWQPRSGELRARLHGHLGSVRMAAYSPDGRILVTAGEDRTARVWRVADGTALCVLEGHAGAINHVTFDATGGRIATSGADDTARVWDASTCAPLASLQGHHGAVTMAAFATDGGRLFTASFDGTAKSWRTTGGPLQAILAGHRDELDGASYSPDGTRVLTFSYDQVARVWDASSGALVASLVGHRGRIDDGEWSGDGRRIITASGDGTARIWDAGSGREERSLVGHDGGLWMATFSPDLALVATAGEDGTVRLWDARSGANKQTLAGHRREVFALTFSPDGRRLLSGALDGMVRIWDRSGQLVRELGPYGGVLDGGFSADGERVLIACTDNQARLWDVASGRLVHSLHHGGIVQSARFDPSGRRIVTASEDRTAKIWDAGTGEAIATLEGHANMVYEASFDPSGVLVVTAGDDRTARLWDATSGREISELRGHAAALTGARFNGAGDHVLTWSLDRTAMLWRIAPYRGGFDALEALARCRLAYRLIDDRLRVAGAEPARCDQPR